MAQTSTLYPGTEADKSMPIAVVGIGCRLPGGASDTTKLWDMLMQKRSARTETPPDRFNIGAFYHPDGDKNGTVNNHGGHYLTDDIAAFDAPFFSISPAEAVSMDPMQRMLLEVAYEATENAGIPLSALSGSNTSCFVGCFTSDYDQLAKRDAELLPKYHSIGTGQSILSNRLSFCFNLKGPSVTLDTACSSSLVAVHLACQSLRTGESDTALVGATNAILSPDIQIGMTNLHFLSPDSICYMFDSRANGYARGEGMAALLLKPLVHALRDGDTIRAVIRGTAVNSNGKMSGITLPSKDAQVALIHSCYLTAGCDPAETGYFEAHGTGTAAGDPIEASAIGEVMGTCRPGGEDGKLFVGSIKTNIGHLEGSSGLAGMIKAIKSLEEGIIAPNIWFDKGSPAIDFDGWRIRVPTEATDWPVSGLRRVSVNGFGYGGTNGHVILDDAYNYMKKRGLTGNHCTRPTSVKMNGFDQSTSARPRVFYLSAHESGGIEEQAKILSAHLSSRHSTPEQTFLDNLSFTLCERRSRLDFGRVVVASSTSELVEGLQSATGTVRRQNGPLLIGFVFTGQGSQWLGMGKELFQYPIFSKSFTMCAEVCKACGAPWSLTEELLKDQKTSRIDQAEISQPLCTALQIALVDLYASWGILPTRVVGHSSGEIAAAYAAGALSLDSAMRVAYFRGLMSSDIQKLGFRGGMLAAGLSEEEALVDIQGIDTDKVDGKIVVACVNSPKSVTLSGDLSAVVHMQKRLTARDVFARKLRVDMAYHSHHMLSASESYRQAIAGLNVCPAEKRPYVTMFSSLRARVLTAEDDLSESYWVENMVSCVRFSDALRHLCTDRLDGQVDMVDFLVELGPHSVLAGPVKQILAALPEPERRPVVYFSALLRNKNAATTALTTAGELFLQGFPTDLHEANFPKPTAAALSVLTDLPTYHWNHTRKYWAESRISRDYRFRPFPRTDILGAPFQDWNPIEPRWRNFIRLSEQPWVAGHVVQGAIVYPAAGYCCMAIQAAAQMHALSAQARGDAQKETVVEYKIRHVAISRALVVPQTTDGVEVVFSMRPHPTSSVTSSNAWREFRIFSYTEAQGWAENCRGLVMAASSSLVSDSASPQVPPTSTNAGTSIPSSDLYAAFDAVGLSYGTTFRGITDVTAAPGHAVATVEVTDTAAMMPKGFEFERLVHPATMDSFLQVSLAALSDGDLKALTKPYIPVHIEEITVSGSISAPIGTAFMATAVAKREGFRDALASVTVTAPEQTVPVIQMHGIRSLAIASSVIDDATTLEPKKHCVTTVWEPDVDLLGRAELNSVLRKGVPPLQSRLRDLELVAYYFFDRVLNEVAESQLETMQSHHRKFFRYMQNQRRIILAHQGELQTDDWTNLSDPAVTRHIQSLIDALSGDSDYEGQMLVRMGKALPSVLRGETDPLTLMMEGNLLQNYYVVSLGALATYEYIFRYITLLSHKYPDLDYLEIGAGTGGCTRPVLEALSGTECRKYPRLKSYTFTDISSGFFEQAIETLGPDWGDKLQFRKLDIDHDPDTQGFHGKQYDVIIAANVLHATHDIQRTISNVRKLLRPGGKLVLFDMTHSLLSVSLVFGNLPGWWNCVEPWREYGPLLTEAKWWDVLQKNGFANMEASTPDVLDPLLETSRLMIFSATVPNAVPETPDNNDDLVLIVEPHNPLTEKTLIEATRAKLAVAGIETRTCALQDVPDDDVRLRKATIISFVELDTSLLANITSAEFDALKRLLHLDAAGGLIWVTRGGTGRNTVRPELGLVLGLARTLRAEREGKRFATVDLETQTQGSVQEEADILVRVLQKKGPETLSVGDRAPDQEFSVENGLVCIKRVIEDTKMNEFISVRANPSWTPQPVQQDIWQSKRPLKLKNQTIGTIDTLVFDDDLAMAEPLPAGHVEIEVRAVGLNFRDVLICLGDVVDDYLGNECAGIVTRIGSDIQHVAVGDRVVAWCVGSFSTSMRNPGQCVAKIPDDLSFGTAAAFPLTYVTAYYGLVHLARLERGESVLIHSGAGGVGQAAIQIAKMQGAQVFTTVGSAEKRKLLMDTYGLAEDHIFSSRDLVFANSILQATGGRGVDVVLNSLAGEALRATWKAIAPFGRFVEIGKKDIAENGYLDMAPFSRNVTFTSVDVTVVFRKDPALAGRIFQNVMELIHSGKIKEQTPLLIQPFSKIRECMAMMQAGKHMGKIVLEPRKGDLVPSIESLPSPITFSNDASYLLVGGLGGIGRSISRWMVRKGARNLIYVSRHGVTSKDAETLIDNLQSTGVRVQVLKCDSADEKHLTESLATTLETMPPIRGVIQAAMVLEDQIFSNMAHGSFMKAIRPKVHGSWSTHQATLGQPLDFFVLLSSAASFIGNVGQSNYASGCTYEVALASHRRSLGLPATAIDIGKVVSVGFLAENTGTVLTQNLKRLGMLSIHEPELLAILEMAMLPYEAGLLSSPSGHLVTGVHCTNDVRESGVELPPWGRDPVFSHMDFVRPHLQSGRVGTESENSGGDNRRQQQQPLPVSLRSSQSTQEASTAVLNALILKLARSLLSQVEDIDPKKSMGAFGVDSLVAVELRNWIQREAKVEIPVFEILQTASLIDLANSVAGKSPLVTA